MIILEEKEKQQQGLEESVAYVEKTVYDVVKRSMDVICSVLALIVLSPVLLITSIAIYIDDPGPIIFKQIRVGKNGMKFMIYKFRSMEVNADAHRNELMNQNQSKGATFKIFHDPRRTRVGKFIRKTSIDELPQLVNILIGDMSVIGPRPFIPEEQNQLPADRLLVKPGLSAIGRLRAKILCQ